MEPAFLILENQENALEPVEGPHATIPEESVPSSESVECDCPDPLEVARTPLPQGATISNDDNRDLETKEVGDLPIPVAAFSSPETDHSTPPESIEATQNPSDPTPQGGQMSEMDVEHEVSHEQLLFPSDDLLPQQQEHTQRDKPRSVKFSHRI